ncbi:response regulator [Anabaena sp. UHCC 0399]|uniref:response regulator n=1 Tax=Anabaena sp. UHCC 0399 TaxID=3110238 RepID=UPI002B21F5CA|nr:response regulator [Anabaena sp. UHCC 0399]MEA5568207.1 response regulator [Anabaena sp. UHCC 0399]
MSKISFNLSSENRVLLEQIPLRKSPSLNGLKILVVDNNEDSLYIVTLIFEDCKVEIKTAKCVDHAIQIIEEWKPDVMISDIGMPEKDAYSLIRFIRNKEIFCGGFLPAVALTSYVYPEYLNEAMDAGFQEVICKPFEPDELVATVANFTPYWY